jgi:hypothetical protein
MEFTQNDIKQFKEIWKAEFGEDLSDADARLAAMLLMRVFSKEG